METKNSGFFSNYPEIPDRIQIGIPISYKLDKIITNDCTQFGCMSSIAEDVPAYHSFINKIFCNYALDSEASVTLRVQDEKKRLEGIFKGKYGDVLSELLDNYKNNLVKRAKERIKHPADDIKCRKVINVKSKMKNMLFYSAEAEIYGTYNASKYVRAVLEEYAELNDADRKRLYYKDIIAQLNAAINDRHMVLIELVDRTKSVDDKTKSKVLPLKIDEDIYKVHLYLAAWNPQSDNEDKFTSFRIDNIISVTPLESITIEDDIDIKLEAAIKTRGIQYLASGLSEIKIRLTDAGKQMYHNITFQRPEVSAIEGEKKNIYIFNVPTFQIKVYFFKFGKDAEILEPDDLRKMFLEDYKAAGELYDVKG